MKDMTRTKRLKRYLIGLVLLYVFLVVARLLYGYYTYPAGTTQGQTVHTAGTGGYSNAEFATKKNYATETQIIKSSVPTNNSGTTVIEQKYEKTATVYADSTHYEDHEKQVRTLIADFKAIIQHEASRGNPGSRSVSLTIGVQPDSFDDFYLKIQAVGRVLNRSVSKIETTNNFLQLKATRASLESTLASLLELKAHKGSIDDYIKLQERILSIEQQLQALGVDLGEFDETNAFCTVRFSLQEAREIKPTTIGFVHRFTVAVEWATFFYAGFIILFISTCIGAFIFLFVVDRFRILQKILNNEGQDSTESGQ